MEELIERRIRQAMQTLAEQLHEASRRVKDGCYDDDAQRSVNSARRETLSDVASAIVAAFNL